MKNEKAKMVFFFAIIVITRINFRVTAPKFINIPFLFGTFRTIYPTQNEKNGKTTQILNEYEQDGQKV